MASLESPDTANHRFLTTPLCIQRDEHGDVLVHSTATARWAHAWWSRSELAAYLQCDWGEVDCGELTGEQLVDWLRVHAPDAGVIVHTLDDERILLPAAGRRR